MNATSACLAANCDVRVVTPTANPLLLGDHFTCAAKLPAAVRNAG